MDTSAHDAICGVAPVSVIFDAVIETINQLGPRQTKKHCCGNIMFSINVSLFAYLEKYCCKNKICLSGRKIFPLQVQKHFWCGSNVS